MLVMVLFVFDDVMGTFCMVSNSRHLAAFLSSGLSACLYHSL